MSSASTIEKSIQKLFLQELIDNDAILGAAFVDEQGVPVIWQLPPVITSKSAEPLKLALEYLERLRAAKLDVLGDLLYTVFRFRRFKVAYFPVDRKGWLILFVNPMWHVELLIPKLRKIIAKLRSM